MGLSKKRQQHLSQITARAAESSKHRKVDRENQRKRRFLTKQREVEDFLDKHEALESESSSDESTIDESSLDKSSSDEEELVDNKEGEDIYEGLGDTNGGVPLEIEDRSFKPIWNDNAGGYLRGIRGCGSSATKKRERRCGRELEKSPSQTRSIVEMFSA